MGSASADVAYHIDSLNTIYLWGTAFSAWSEWSAKNKTMRRELIYSPGDYSFEGETAKTMGRPFIGLEDGIWYERMFDDSTGHALGFGYYGGVYMRDSLLNTKRIYASVLQNNIEYREHNKGNDQFHCFELFYTLPFGMQDTSTGLFAYELETGTEGSVDIQNIVVEADTLWDGTYHRWGLMSSETLLRTNAVAAYANLTYRNGNLTAKGGLRGERQWGWCEYADAAAQSYRFSALTYVPSIHITYTTPGMSILGVSYTRRMEAPQGSDYSTRRFYSLDGYSVGNELLKIGNVHHLEAKWDKYFEGVGAVGVNLFYAAKTDQKGELTDVVLEDAVFGRLVTYSKPINIGDSWNGGMDLHLTYRPNAFVNVRFNGSVFYDYMDVQFRPEEQAYTNGMWCYSLRLNAWVKLKNKVQLFGNVYYNSPTQNVLNTILSRKGLDLGVNADLCHQRLSIGLGVNDVFGWNKWSTVSNNPYLGSDVETTIQSRYINMGVTVRFGKMELESEPRRAIRSRNHADGDLDENEAF